jgi:hypothetical protein
MKLEIVINMSENLPLVHSPRSAVQPGHQLKELDLDNAFDNAFKMVSIYDVVVIFVHPNISQLHSIGNRI